VSRDIYALLVGVDEYPAPVPPLRGCVNDVAAAAALLTARADAAGDRCHVELLTDHEATREAVIAAFRAHLGQARDGDSVVFWFAGHGAQEPALPEHWVLEPDRLNETLVLVDSRQPDIYDLADKELAQLVAEVADGGPHDTEHVFGTANAGRYLLVVLTGALDGRDYVVTARDMTESERRSFARRAR
jgi:hypothetical protein